MIRKFLNWLFGKKQETPKYAPLPTLEETPTNHKAVIVDTYADTREWHAFEGPSKTVSEAEVKAEVINTIIGALPSEAKSPAPQPEPKVINNSNQKRKYHKKKNKH